MMAYVFGFAAAALIGLSFKWTFYHWLGAFTLCLGFACLIAMFAQVHS